MSPRAYECFKRQTANVRIAAVIRTWSDEEVEDFFGLRRRPARGVRARANAAEDANVAYFLAATGHVCPSR